MHVKDVDIACLCETWLTDFTLDSMIASRDFSIFRQDRADTRRGGGVCIIGKNSSCVFFKSVDLPTRYQSLEIVVVDILFGNNNGVRLAVVEATIHLINSVISVHADY